ncbi:DUF3304 domain-containing protein [Ralstonia sp. A12]|uniref:DUF3304 domain-containing protein n=1 Tax=Ralstonia sp. A12 TaxID=1217052 RepID=UPI00069382AD|nr:DUF3304 domain-containing protein [Ralstonia sp. A12]
MKKFPRTIGVILVGVLLLAVSACSQGSEKLSAEVLAHNYTDEYIAAFTINGAYIGNAAAHGYGGFVCCVRLPKTWKPGLTVKIKWTKDDRTNDFWKEKVVEIPPYSDQDIGHFAVHFFPNDDVKVLVTMKAVGHPDYPYPSPTIGK